MTERKITRGWLTRYVRLHDPTRSLCGPQIVVSSVQSGDLCKNCQRIGKKEKR